jgi:hypothetical protein
MIQDWDFMQNKDERKLLITEQDEEKMLAEFVTSCEKDGLTENDYKETLEALKLIAEKMRLRNG